MSALDQLRDQMLPGSLFDRLQLDRLDAVDQRNAEVQLGELSEVSADVGMFNNMLNIRGDVTIDQTTSPATFGGSGVVDCWPAIEVFSGVYAVWIAINAGVVTFYINSTDGKAYAGAGAVTLSQIGLSLVSPSAFDSKSSVQWYTSDGIETAEITSFYNGVTPNRNGYLRLRALGESGGNGINALQLIAGNNDGGGGFTGIRLYNKNSSGPLLQYVDAYGNLGTLHYGDVAAPVLVNTASKTTVYTRVIKAGSLGPNGVFHVKIPFEWKDNTGGARDTTVTVDWGTESFSWAQGSLGLNANSRKGYIELWLANLNSASTQKIECAHRMSAPEAVDTAVGASTGCDLAIHHDGALDTSAADRTLTISLTLLSTSQGVNYYAQTMGAIADGPYYGA